MLNIIRITTKFSRLFEDKKINFSISVQNRAMAHFNKSTPNQVDQDQQINKAIDNFIKQRINELKKLILDYDILEISLTAGTNNKIVIHEQSSSDLNEKIGKIYFNIDQLLNY